MSDKVESSSVCGVGDLASASTKSLQSLLIQIGRNGHTDAGKERQREIENVLRQRGVEV